MHVCMIDQGDALAAHTAQQASEILQRGGLVVFPTETVYGIGASAASQSGMTALCRFKDRPHRQPFTIHLPQPAAAELYVDAAVPLVRRAIQKMMPGPVTLVIEVDEAVIESKLRALNLPEDVRHHLYHRNTVGLRCPHHPVAQQVLASIDQPVVASSANRRTQPPPFDAAEAADAVGDEADLLIDGGRCQFSKPSTIVRVGPGPSGVAKVVVERAGVYDDRYIRKLLRWTMLIVCSGNTCRSPMAEVMAKDMLAKRQGLSIDELDAAGLFVMSAGHMAAQGMPASEEAVQAMAKLGLDLSQHRSSPLTPQVIQDADAIYCMTSHHVQGVLEMFPSAADKTFKLDPSGDVEDPIGNGANGYHRCAELIRRRLEQRLMEQQP